MPKKGGLKNALARHTAAQQLKARQKAADEAQERKHASVLASAHGAANGKRKGKGGGRASLTSSGSTEGAQGKLSAKARGKQRLVEPFQADDTILLVGEGEHRPSVLRSYAACIDDLADLYAAGNFSFTLSLLSAPRNHNPALIVATAYDSEAECYRKYPDAADIVKRIRELANRQDIVQFGVDGGNLERTLTHPSTLDGSSIVRATGLQKQFSKIWFGFPHVGAGHKDEARNVLANQLLLCRFLISAAPLLSEGQLPNYAREDGGGKRKGNNDEEEEDSDAGGDEDEGDDPEQDGYRQQASKGRFLAPPRAGSIMITLRNASPYTLWDVPLLGKRLATVLPAITASAPALPKGVRPPKLEDAERSGARFRLWRSFEFVPTAWAGYSHRRTVGWVEGLSTGNNEDLLREGKAESNKGPSKLVKHAGTGECRTWEFGKLTQAK